jgi:hypothetical protein
MFSPTRLPLTGGFLFFAPFSVNPRHCHAWKAWTFLRYWNRRAWHRWSCYAQSCLGHLFFPILTSNWTVTECLNVCLPALYSKPRPCDSLSVGVNYFLEWGGVPNKLSTTEFIFFCLTIAMGSEVYRCRILIWASLIQQENNPAATGYVNYYVDYNSWIFL